MGGYTFLVAYDIAIRERNFLIQVGKLAPWPPISLFQEMPTHQPIVAHIPTITTSHPLIASLKNSTSPKKLEEIKIMIQSMMQENKSTKHDFNLILQNIENMVMTLQSKNAQGSRPY